MKVANVSFLAICVVLLQTNSAWAYLDPGTGSMILQGIIGGVVAGWAAIQFNLLKIKTFFSSKAKTEKVERTDKQD